MCIGGGLLSWGGGGITPLSQLFIEQFCDMFVSYIKLAKKNYSNLPQGWLNIQASLAHVRNSSFAELLFKNLRKTSNEIARNLVSWCFKGSIKINGVDLSTKLGNDDNAIKNIDTLGIKRFWGGL